MDPATFGKGISVDRSGWLGRWLADGAAFVSGRSWWSPLCACLAGMLPGTAVLAEAPYPEIEYAAPIPSVWTTRMAANGEPDNPLFHLADKLFSSLDIRWHARSYPAPRMFKYLQQGEAQFSMLVRTGQLQDCCLYSRKPVATAEIWIYGIGDQPRLRTQAELAGKSVITVHGYSYGGLVEFLADPANRVRNNVAQSHEAAVRMLVNRRADYLIDYRGPASEVLGMTPVPGLWGQVLSRQEIFLVLSRGYPDAERLMARLEALAESPEALRLRPAAGR